MKTQTLSRRDFFKRAGLASLGSIVASCSSASGNQVRILIDSWALAYAPFKEMAEKYNALHPDAQIKVEPSPGGWMTKVTGQIRSGKLQWSAAGVMSTFNDLAAWVQLGLIQPIDDYLAASTETDATAFLSDMLPTIRDDETLEGKIYGLPFSVENISYHWNTDWFGKAGIAQAPQTWQELYDYGQAIKDYLASEGNTETYALGFDLGHLNRNLGALFFAISDQPYTDEGWFDWDSGEMRESLRFMRKLSRNGLTPPDCGEGLEIVDMWKRGRLASLFSCSSRGVWAQKVIGFDQVATAQVPTADGQPHCGASFWCNSVSLLKTAPMAQQAVDFLVYACGPQNAGWQKAIIEAGTSPAFASVYSSMIESDPAYEPYRWMNELQDRIAISVPSPKNYYYQIQNEAWTQHWPAYLKDDSTMTEDELIAQVLETCAQVHQQVLDSVPTLVP